MKNSLNRLERFEEEAVRGEVGVVEGREKDLEGDEQREFVRLMQVRRGVSRAPAIVMDAQRGFSLKLLNSLHGEESIRCFSSCINPSSSCCFFMNSSRAIRTFPSMNSSSADSIPPSSDGRSKLRELENSNSE